MTKNYCDRCGKELENHEGKFLKFNKRFTVDFIDWHFLGYKKEIYDADELCKDCWKKFLDIYDKFMKNKESNNGEEESNGN